MSDKFSYSVAIRTLGTSGVKYEKLLKSIASQTIQPEEIFVVLPKGYLTPKFKLGCERFVFSDKGMLPQRFYPIDSIDSEYILFCDDDVEFDCNFVKKLSDPLLYHKYDCVAGPLLSFFPPKKIKYFFASLLGGACVMIFGRKDIYVRLLRTTGWSYNNSVKTDKHMIYKTDSLAGTCFCASRESVKKIHMEDEFWAEKNIYSAFEDQIFFTKLKINGFRSCVVSDAIYIHNDGKTSIQDLKLEPAYSHAFNRYVYWHRFWYDISNSYIEKIRLRICFEYSNFMGRIYDLLRFVSGRISREYIKTKKSALKDAKKFLKTKEYSDLPSPIIISGER